jgi:hypothetical protein
MQVSVRKHIFEALGSGWRLFRLLCGSLSLCGCCTLSGFLVLWCISGGGSFRLASVGGGPEGQVVPQQLHDQRAVTVGFFGKRVELSDSIIKGLLGEVTGSVW